MKWPPWADFLAWTLYKPFSHLGSSKTQDFYDISLVDGYNIQMSMAPVAGTYGGQGGQYYCARAGCNTDLNVQCPEGKCSMPRRVSVQCPEGECSMPRRWVFNVQKVSVQCPEGECSMSRKWVFNVQKVSVQCPEGECSMSRRWVFNVQKVSDAPVNRVCMCVSLVVIFSDK